MGEGISGVALNGNLLPAAADEAVILYRQDGVERQQEAKISCAENMYSRICDNFAAGIGPGNDLLAIGAPGYCDVVRPYHCDPSRALVISQPSGEIVNGPLGDLWYQEGVLGPASG